MQTKIRSGLIRSSIELLPIPRLQVPQNAAKFRFNIWFSPLDNEGRYFFE